MRSWNSDVQICVVFYTDDAGRSKPMLNQGTHTLPLYCAPLPDVRTMIADCSQSQRHGHASVKLRISHGNCRHSSASTSEESDSDADDNDADVIMNEVSVFTVCFILSCTESRFMYVEEKCDKIYRQ